jgi:hypothetical protein
MGEVLGAGRPIQAIAGFELRIAEPLLPEAFDEFNRIYFDRLRDIGLLVDGLVPLARTNVAPTIPTVHEPSIYAMSFTVRTARSRPAFVLSGTPEDKPGDARAMIDSIMNSLTGRLKQIDASWEDATAIQLYGVDDLQGLIVDNVLSRLGPAAVHGIRWFPSRPPVSGLRLEIDVHAAGTELIIALR